VPHGQSRYCDQDPSVPFLVRSGPYDIVLHRRLGGSDRSHVALIVGLMRWDDLKGVLVERSRAVAGLLRVSHAGEEVPGSDWSPPEIGAHVVSLSRRYMRMMESPEPFPESLSALDEAEIRAVRCSDVDELADMLVSAVDDLVGYLGDDGSRPVPFFGMKHTAEAVGALMLGELLLHGFDLARALRRPWVIGRDEAIAVLGGLLPAVGYSADPDVAQRAVGTYHLRIRHGHDWTIEVRDGAATVQKGRPERADLHISADPLAFLLVGYGRASRWRAVLTGRIVGWGRHPLRAARFSKLFRET
jgi:SCP-2 sterol transfer family